MDDTEMINHMARAMKRRAAEPLANISSLDPVLVGSLGDAWIVLAQAALAALRKLPVSPLLQGGGP